MIRIDKLIKDAIKEDVGRGDITSRAVIPKWQTSKALVTAKEEMVVAGLHVAIFVFKTVDKNIDIKIKVKDGERVKKGTVLMEAIGPTRSLLTAERTALNFMQRLSGIATLTSKFVKAAGPKVKILDTRKTGPLWRILEKYAVRKGGGFNHRTGLYDMYLIKNNHVDSAGSVTEAILRAKHHRGHKRILIETEVRDNSELFEAVTTGADVIMLDNFTPKDAKKWIKNAKVLAKAIKNDPKFEISGGISPKNIKEYAKTGADYISIGSLTHSTPAADIHMKINA